MRGTVRMFLAAVVVALVATNEYAVADESAGIRQVQSMPDLPSPFSVRNWKQVATDLDQLLFDPNVRGEYLPILHLVRDGRGDIIGFGLPDYVGDLRQPTDGTGNGIVGMGAVWGATLVGIDKSRGSHDYVKMCENYFHRRPNYQMIGNGVGHCDPNKTFWYTLFPNIIFASISERYQDESEMSDMAHRSAVSWAKAAAALADPAKNDAANFDHTGFDFDTMQGVDNGQWKEPDAGAGVALEEEVKFAALEHFVRAHPSQWLWLHRRWKPMLPATSPCTTTPSSSPVAPSPAG